MSSPSTSERASQASFSSATTPEKDGFTASKSKWRPIYHFMPQSGWMNDPCAPGFDPVTGLYHLSFQWNPNGPDWGDICWGTATSPDMISWHVQSSPILLPDSCYDAQGVFTGCFLKAQDGSLNYIYTSVSSLPIHHTLPHQYGSETLSVATSFDHGATWEKSNKNPILPGEPPGLDVTGWRDPFCAPWTNMSQALGLNSTTIFGIISGGIRDMTPTSFLYKINENDVSDWSYICPLTNFGLNFRPSRWSGDFGRNWEVTNFLTMADETDPSVNHDFLIMGTEGCIEPTGPCVIDGPSRPSRGQLWMSGSIEKNKTRGTVQMNYGFGGYLDHGCMYAANSFFDPKTQKQVVWGWITEEDLCDDLRHQQGWSGVMSMPRQLYLQTLHNVVKASVSGLSSITSINLEPEGGGLFTVQTLASEPYRPLVESLRIDSRLSRLGESALTRDGASVGFPVGAIQSNQWEVECSFRVSESCSSVGISIGHTKDFDQCTTMVFKPRLETFVITRPSFQAPGGPVLANSHPESAPHTLFTRQDPETNEKYPETLDIRAWRDSSVLEVFVNGRTAISSRLYTGEETFGIRVFAKDDISAENVVSDRTMLEYAKLWDGVGN